MSIEQRVTDALASWKAGSITHNLYLELAALVEEFHKVLGLEKAAPAIAPVAPAQPEEVSHVDQD
jgi:hypothetical protein